MATHPDGPYKYNIAIDFAYIEKWYPPELQPLWRNYQAPLSHIPWKDDDIMIVTYPRSGTHMLWYMTRWILQKSTKPLPDTPEESFINQFSYRDKQKAGRRVFSGHFIPFVITDDVILNGNRKFIHVIRNPKDMLVSYYNILQDMNKMFPVQVTLEELARKCIENDYPCAVTGRSWFDHTKAFEEFMTRHPEAPILLLYYEDVVKDMGGAVRQVADFLNVDLDSVVVNEIADNAQFDKMKHCRVGDTIDGTGDNPDGPRLYRKGIIGDWKTVFTVAQNEDWDKKAADLMKGWKIFDKIIYEDPDSKHQS